MGQRPSHIDTSPGAGFIKRESGSLHGGLDGRMKASVYAGRAPAPVWIDKEENAKSECHGDHRSEYEFDARSYHCRTI